MVPRVKQRPPSDEPIRALRQERQASPARLGGRYHVLVIALLYVLIIPVARVDQRDLRGGGGNWIALDLRGLYVGAYLVAVGLVTALVLLHLSVKRWRRPFSFGLLLACLFAPALAVPVGCAIYGAYVRHADESKAKRITETANALAAGLHVRRTIPAEPSRRHFEVELTSTTAVELVAIFVSGSAESRHGDFVHSSREPQPPLQLRPGVPRRVTLTLDTEPTPDTYWRISCDLVAQGVEASVSWVDPSQEPAGGDAVRRIPLRQQLEL